MWHLISGSGNIDPAHFPSAPVTWHLLDSSAPLLPTDVHWPRPVISDTFFVTEMRVQKIFPFSDRRSVTAISIGSTTIFLIDGSKFRCGYEEKNRYHETIELLVAFNATDTIVTNCRSAFRPRFMIACGAIRQDYRSFSNLIVSNSNVPRKDPFSFSPRGLIIPR